MKMKTTNNQNKPLIFSLLMMVITSSFATADISDLTPFDSTKGWQTYNDATLNKDNPKTLTLKSGNKKILSNPQKASFLTTKKSYQDHDISIEFMIPQDSDSGIYVQGCYEIQITDSHSKGSPHFDHMGGLYEQSRNKKGGVAPSSNAALPAGEWQTMTIQFRAPRFNKEGQKINNALFHPQWKNHPY